VKLSWQNDSDRLECRWSDEKEGDDAFPYEAPWAHEESASLMPEAPDFANASPFGHSEWGRERPVTQV
jgi:hypothetical protein